MGEDAARSGGERTIFLETEGELDVRAELARLHPSRFFAQREAESLEQALAAAGCVPFAEFETVRALFRLENVAIDVDAASFGHGVMELEVMCETEAGVAAAEADIARVAARVQAQPLDGASGGKLESYIRRFCPEMLAHLLEAGVLA